MKLGGHFYQALQPVLLTTGRDEMKGASAFPVLQSELVSSSNLLIAFSAFWLNIPHFHSSAMTWGFSWFHGSLPLGKYQAETRDLALPDREPNTMIPFNLN